MSILNFISQTTIFIRRFIFKEEKKTIYDFIIKGCIYLIVFLIPLFFLPITSDMLELPKALLFYFLTLVATVTWLTKIVIKKEALFTRTFLDILIIIFGLIYIASTIFSVNKYNSLVGSTGYFSETLITILFLILFYFLVVNNVKNREEILKLVIVLLTSITLLIIFNFFQIFGLYLLPWIRTKDVSFDLITGSPVIFSIILTAVIPLIFSLLIASKKRVNQWLLSTLLFLDLILIFIINSFIGIINLIVGLFILIIFLTSRSRELKSQWIIISTLILALAVLGLFIRVNDLTGIVLPLETNLPFRMSGQIILSSISDSPLLGVGPENFSYLFSKYRPLEFNKNNFWNGSTGFTTGLNFNRASNFWFNLLAGTGLLGTLILLTICFWFLIKIFKDFFKPYLERSANHNWYLGTGIFLSWLTLFVSSFLYSFSFVTIFLFLLFLTLGVIFLIKEKETPLTPNLSIKEIKDSNAAAFISSLSFSLFLILGISFIYLASRYLLADIYFIRAADSASPIFDARRRLGIEEIVSKINQTDEYLVRAIRLNPYEKNYHFSLAKINMVKMQLIATEPGPKTQENLNNLIKAVLDEIDRGINLDKTSTISYLSAINLYKDLRDLIGSVQVDPLILDAYSRVINLDLNNPEHYLGRGQIYQNEAVLIYNNLANLKEGKDKQTAINQANQLLNLAEQDFNQAITLKIDFLPGYYNLALVKEKRGDKEGAIKELEKALKINFSDLDILYNLGRLYLDNNKLDEAINVLSRAVNLYPKHSNSHWLLGMVYEKKGEKDKAIQEIKIVNWLNPDDEMVKKKLEELKK